MRLLSNPYVLAGTHLSLALLSGFMGWKLRDADYQRHLKGEAQAQVTTQIVTREVEGRNEEVSQSERDALATQQQKVQVVYRTTTKEIPVYVTHTEFEERVVASGGLPAGLVWTYNRSASNSEAPLPTGLDADAPAGVSVSELAGVTAGNFALCHTYRDEVGRWHSWYNRLLADWPGASTDGKEPTQ